MRLGQLARHVDVSPKEIVAYFDAKGITINAHLNSRLPDDLEEEVLKVFGAPATPQQAPEEKEPDQPVNTPEPDEEMKEEQERAPEAAMAVQDAQLSERPHEEEKEAVPDSEEPKLIRAPKIELPGLKVVGRIDLPEPRKPEPKPEPAPEEKPEKENPKVISHHRRNGRKRLTEEEREARRLKNKKAKEKRMKLQAQKKKELEEKKIKEARTLYYQQKISKPKSAQKKAKKKAQKPAEAQKQQEPRTLLGKFWLWLNT